MNASKAQPMALTGARVAWLAALLLAACSTRPAPGSRYEVGDPAMSDQALMTRPLGPQVSEADAISAHKAVTETIRTEFDAPVTILHSELPDYPADVEHAGIQGVVNIGFVVDERGNVEAARVLESPDPRLSAVCLEAVSKWRFEPLTRQGQPVKGKFTQRFPFRLK